MSIWSEKYNENNVPQMCEISQFINSPLWDEICNRLKKVYALEPQLSYSKCSGQMGWNIKYKYKGKSLCTLYPENGYFIALIVISDKDVNKAEAILPLLTKYSQDLYNNTLFMKKMGKWLMINVTDNNILKDVYGLIDVKAQV